MTFDAPTATLVAASIAGFLSLTNLVVSWRHRRSAEEREQYRGLLKPHVETLGANLHTLLAAAKVAGKRMDLDQPPDSWMTRSESAAKNLKDMVLKVKYPLWSVVDGLRELTRLPNWLRHVRDQAARRGMLLAAAEALRSEVDTAIRNAFLSGVQPGHLQRWRVTKRTKELRAVWLAGRPAEGSIANSDEAEDIDT